MPLFQSNDISQMTVQLGQLYCFGFGYVAARLGKRVLDTGGALVGTARSAEKANQISGIAPHAKGVVWDEHEVIDPDSLNGAHWLISIPPNEEGCPAFRLTSGIHAQPRSITYLSTVGVYGDRNGDWVSENTPVNPQSDRAKRRVLAERQWQSLDAHIVRLPGIYGPGRSVFDRLRAGKARRIIKDGQVFNRIHVDDIVGGLEQILPHPSTGIWHLCDDEPAPPQDVVSYAAELLGFETPPDIAFEDADLSAMGRSFYSECKRVSNAVTKSKLNWQLQYPSYREGLRAILKTESKT